MPRPLDYRIRPGTPSDGAAILRVHRASILGLGRQAYSRKETASWAAGLTPEGYGQAMTEGGEAYLVAEDSDGAAVAFCSFKADEVVGLYVDPKWARRGVGSALLSHAETAIVAAGHGTVRIRSSLSGRAFYESRGFAAVQRRNWKTRGGLVIAVVDMEKTLTQAERS